MANYENSNSEEMKARIQTLVQIKALGSVNKFSAMSNVSRQSLYDYFNGKINYLSIPAIITLLNSYPELSAEWLLRGVGDMNKNNVPVTPVEENVEKDSPELSSSNELLKRVADRDEIIKDLRTQLAIKDKQLEAKDKQLEALISVLGK